MRSMIQSVIFLITSILLLSAVVFAWFSITQESSIQPISANVIRRDIDFDVAYGKNGGSYVDFNDPADINAFLKGFAAGDTLNIRVIVENKNLISDPDLPLSVRLFNIRSTETEIEYDLLDFYSLQDQTVYLTWYENLAQYDYENPYATNSIVLDIIDPTEVIYDGVALMPSRISNMLDYYINEFDEIVKENNISIFEGTIASKEILVIEFAFYLDPYTPEGLGFENGELLIDGLYSFFGE